VAEKDGYRAIIQTRVPWVKGGGKMDSVAFMRVNWSAKRVCLEAIEVPAENVDVSSSQSLETSIIARFGDKPAAGRISMLVGAEYRQPMSCTLKTK
jgi:hypothetical protein